MKKIAIYPGTFDPITNGHLDIIKRSAKLFDSLIIGVAISENKRPLFSLESRVEMVRLAVDEILQNSNLECEILVKGFSGLLVDFAAAHNSNYLIRGLRAVNDFEYELQIGYANKSMSRDIETIYFMPSLPHAFVSSSVVRSILEFNTRCEHLVPPAVYRYILELRNVCGN